MGKTRAKLESIFKRGIIRKQGNLVFYELKPADVVKRLQTSELLLE